VKALFPGMSCKMELTHFPFCSDAWAMSLDRDGNNYEILAWGQYTDQVVELLGNDPKRYVAIGVGMGLERMACAHFGIDDIRKVEGIRLT
jgi:phenylalanyl-tRNA synthetase alpha subunit